MNTKEINRISVQIRTHLYPEEINKLDKIVCDYKFRSRYQLIQTIIRSFLRAADPEEDEVVCIDFIEMFDTVIKKTSI